MAQDENSSRTYPYDPFEDLFCVETFDLLQSSKKEGEVHIPTVARMVLEELRKTGLLHRRDTEPPENIRKARVDNRQEVWVRFDTHRDDEGYMAVEVVDAPRSDGAILAAVTAFVLELVDLELPVFGDGHNRHRLPGVLRRPDGVLRGC